MFSLAISIKNSYDSFVMKKLYFATAGIVLLLFVSWWAKSTNYKFTFPNPQNVPTQEEHVSHSPIIIMVTSQGIYPPIIYIRDETKVTWLNKSGHVLDITSTSLSDLNTSVPSGKSTSVTFGSQGIYHYSIKGISTDGSVVVE